MNNSSEVTFFILAAYGDVGPLKYLYFSIILLWFLFIWVSNLFVVAAVFVDRRLHEPMYILLCNLFLNEISSGISLYPLLLSQMLSDTHEISLTLCFLQMCHIYISASVEFGTLAAMAYDRYVSICYPLYYNVMITNGKAAVFIVLIWSFSVANFTLMGLVTVRVKFCGNVINKVFCDHHLVIKLACSASTISKLSDIFFGIVTMLIPFSFIAVSYLKILAVCLKMSGKSKQKALATCTPQIMSVSNLLIGCAFHFADSRFDKMQLPSKMHILFSVYLVVCQPVSTPYLYGFGLPKIRQSCGRLLFSRNKS